MGDTINFNGGDLGYLFGCAYNEHETGIPTTLKTVTVLGGSIGDYAFYNCSSIINIIISDGVTGELGGYAFGYCSNLTNITLGNGISRISGYSFETCEKLQAIHVKDISIWFGIEFSSHFANPFYGMNASRNAGLYVNGEKLTNIIVPDGITIINDYVFCGYNYATEVIIPASVTHIGIKALQMSCKNITLLSTVPPTIDTSSLPSIDITITVPIGCGAVYKAAEGWSEYADYIVEEVS
jgi:hypothetical protein